MVDATREGFRPPSYCPRNRTDCKSLSQIISTDHSSFICCGENDGTARPVPQDEFTFCHKSEVGVDALIFVDARDMAHMAGVLAFAAAIVAPVVPEAKHE